MLLNPRSQTPITNITIAAITALLVSSTAVNANNILSRICHEFEEETTEIHATKCSQQTYIYGSDIWEIDIFATKQMIWDILGNDPEPRDRFVIEIEQPDFIEKISPLLISIYEETGILLHGTDMLFIADLFSSIRNGNYKKAESLQRHLIVNSPQPQVLGKIFDKLRLIPIQV